MKKLFVILFLLISSVVFAETSLDYKVENLKISKTDKDATTARQNAMYQGQREAFNIVLKRLNIDDSNGILVSNDEISQMIRSMQIKNEKITNDSYSAVLNVDFSSDYIKYTLGQYKITKYSPRLDSYLIIPVLNENGQIYLWEKGNRWFNSFRKSLENDKNIFLPNLDYSTKNSIDINDFNKPSFSNFKNVANLYNINNVALVIGNYDKGGDFIDTKVYILSQDGTKTASLNYEISNLSNVNLDFDDASARIVDYLNNLLEKDVETRDSGKMILTKDSVFVFIPISSISDFSHSEDMLKANKNLIEVNLRMITKNMSVYSVKIYNNDIKSFINSLKKDGFSVSEKKDGIYIFI